MGVRVILYAPLRNHGRSVVLENHIPWNRPHFTDCFSAIFLNYLFNQRNPYGCWPITRTQTGFFPIGPVFGTTRFFTKLNPDDGQKKVIAEQRPWARRASRNGICAHVDSMFILSVDRFQKIRTISSFDNNNVEVKIPRAPKRSSFKEAQPSIFFATLVYENKRQWLLASKHCRAQFVYISRGLFVPFP